MKKIINRLFKGFTLVELIIVIAIVAILSVAAFLVVTKWIGKSRDARRLSDVGTMVRSVTLYKSENGNVPMPSGSISTGTIETPDGEEDFSYVGTFGKETVGQLDNLQVVPTDPMIEGQEYQYGVSDNKKEFEVGVTLEGDEESAFMNSVFALREIAKVDGNYTPKTVILTGNVLKIIPSLLFVTTGGKIKDLGEGEVYFIVDGGNNKGYTIYEESITGDSKHVSLKRAVGNGDANFSGVNLSTTNLTGIITYIRNNSLGEYDLRNKLQDTIGYVKEVGIGGELSTIDSVEDLNEDIEKSISNYSFIPYTLSYVQKDTPEEPTVHRSCLDWKNAGHNENGTYTVYPEGNPIEVYCEMNVAGGGWTLVFTSNSTKPTDITYNESSLSTLNNNAKRWSDSIVSNLQILGETMISSLDVSTRTAIRRVNEPTKFKMSLFKNTPRNENFEFLGCNINQNRTSLTYNDRTQDFYVGFGLSTQYGWFLIYDGNLNSRWPCNGSDSSRTNNTSGHTWVR